MSNRRDRKHLEEKAKALIAQMTTEEKVSQIMHKAPAIPKLGIPAYNWWNEALHGVARAGLATVFPQAIALAATWDEELLEEVASAISTEGRAKYHQQEKAGDQDIYKGLTFWSPNVNIFRDPRWGRGHETYGEDPYLTSKLAKAYIDGLQGRDEDYLKAAACAKHFAVHSGPEEGRHSFNATCSTKDLYETYLPAFQYAVQEAAVESIMGAYNRFSGEPCCASEYLLQEILRDEWGFAGHVVSDCWAIADIWQYHKYFENPTDAVVKALEAGCDLSCGDCYSHAYDAVIEGKMDEKVIDQALVRLFTTRFLLGQMDEYFEGHPYTQIPYSVVDSKEHQALNLETAAKSAVLLKNNGILPLDKKKIQSIGIIGPNANSIKALESNYEGRAGRYWTITDGIQEYLRDTEIRTYVSEGCHIWRDYVIDLAEKNDRASEVKAISDEADLIIAVFGLNPELEGEQGDQGNAFASGDKPNLQFPGIQREVLKQLYDSGKPVVLINVSGSCLALDEDAQKADAIFQYFYPGAMGGLAIAELLFGDRSPEGKLPLSFYSENYELPDFEDYSMENRTYRYHQGQVLYPFGFGLTYGKASLKEASVVKEVDSTYRVKVRVKNTADRAIRETLQVYAKAPELGPKYPRLIHFEKIALAGAEEKEITMVIHEDALRVFDDKGKLQRVKGAHKIYLSFAAVDPRTEELLEESPKELEIVLD